ncbi:MAG: hypothetical protein A2X61_06705 [Ignavibacteria bacterium GWB2_35_12]|nr:MAG: hypothetical protein A2X63_02670 [Ignavibacteria bacterium GWA2_35_8]OGU38630.1 MAG: hypothetical protein A2X61_06705 [Ignavibacteria bacterium GWB2_35_12]OGU93976.1 MAG: hypothetical protein A2220_04450 [Ignavibacteria bacterium RIFOXYA2_FULL_35_10]OGV22833.1 MAG: hypothetical protein A2475_02290 [Ignavibacteria bacterium RIFOXYC2_FULL_35_21]
MLKDVNNIELALEPTLFWDVDLKKIDFNKYSNQVISKVIMYGNLSDWFEIKRYYGLDKIKEAALQLRYLDKLTLNFCSWYFNIPKEQFRCYNTQQSVKEHWDY